MSDEVHGNGQVDVSGLSAFVRMLDAYGAIPERWPADRRAGAQVLLDRPDAIGANARRALAEARALDRLLAAPPVLDGVRVDALAARIVAAAHAGATAPAAVSNVVQITAGRRRVTANLPAVQARGNWAAAAVLAASLLVGVVIGPGSLGLPALHDAADTFGLGGYVDQLALAPVEDEGIADEDVL